MSTAQPRGISFAWRSYTSIVPRGTTLVAMSRTKGSSEPVGTATLIGFVPRIAFRPYVGTTRGAAFVMLIPMRLWGTAMSA